MKTPSQFTLLMLLSGLMAVGPLATDMYLPSLPAMAEEFGTTTERMTLTFSIYLIGFGGGQIIWGPMADRFGRRPIILIGLFVFALTSFGCAMATNVESLIAMRFLQALAAAAGPVGSRSSVRDRFTPAEAAGIFGLLAAIFAVVPMIAPAAGGVMQEQAGWTGNFWVMGGYAVLLALLFIALIPESLDPALRQPIKPIAILRGYVTLLKDRALLSLLLMVAGIYAGLFAFLSGSSFVFQDLYALSPSEFGVLFGIMVSGFFVGSLITHPLTRRLGTRSMLRLGMSMIALAALLYGAIAVDGIGNPTIMIIAQTVFAFGVGIASPQISAAAMANYPHMAGTAAALQGFTQLVSGALSGFMVGLLYDGTARPMTAIIAFGCVVGTAIYVTSIARRW